MKTLKTTLACIAGLSVAAGLAVAQDDGGGRPREVRGGPRHDGGGGRPPEVRGGPRQDGDQGPGEAPGGGPGGNQPMRRPPQMMKPPLIAALDANDDGVIDEKELDMAAASLRKLDKNGDGKLDRQELMPPRPVGPPPGGEGGQIRGNRPEPGPGRGEGGERRGPPLPPDRQ